MSLECRVHRRGRPRRRTTSRMTGKPTAPAKVPSTMGRPIHQSEAWGARPSGMMTKPALLKIEADMNTAYQAACRRSRPRVRKRGRSTSARTPSTPSAVKMTARRREATSPRRDWFSEAASIRWVRPTCRETAKDSREASVIMPRPPTAAPAMMTAWPKGDQAVAVSTVVSPVTQTAEVAVNRASTRLAPRWPPGVAIGRRSRTVTTAIMAAKTATASRAGEKRAARSSRLRTPSRSSRDAGPPVRSRAGPALGVSSGSARPGRRTARTTRSGRGARQAVGRRGRPARAARRRAFPGDGRGGEDTATLCPKRPVRSSPTRL